MKFGTGEIILILVVAFVVLFVVRIIRMAQESEEIERHSEELTEIDQGERSCSPRTRTILIGLLIVVIGVVVLTSSLSLIKWVFWGPIGALIAILAGIAILILARIR
jgi:uncharacterized membrane protein YjfL (UPF0719 family)